MSTTAVTQKIGSYTELDQVIEGHFRELVNIIKGHSITPLNIWNSEQVEQIQSISRAMEKACAEIDIIQAKIADGISRLGEGRLSEAREKVYQKTTYLRRLSIVTTVALECLELVGVLSPIASGCLICSAVAGWLASEYESKETLRQMDQSEIGEAALKATLAAATLKPLAEQVAKLVQPRTYPQAGGVEGIMRVYSAFYNKLPEKYRDPEFQAMILSIALQQLQQLPPKDIIRSSSLISRAMRPLQTPFLTPDASNHPQIPQFHLDGEESWVGESAPPQSPPSVDKEKLRLLAEQAATQFGMDLYGCSFVIIDGTRIEIQEMCTPIHTPPTQIRMIQLVPATGQELVGTYDVKINLPSEPQQG